jgi:hypothetical protein
MRYRADARRYWQAAALACLLGATCWAVIAASRKISTGPATTIPSVFDERDRPCDQSYMFATPPQLDPADSVRGGDRAQASAQLSALWPTIVSGCVNPMVREQVAHLMELAWTQDELSEASDQLRRMGDASVPRSLTILGTVLPLPEKQCDFHADATCKTGSVPLTAEGVRHLQQRLWPLSRSWKTGSHRSPCSNPCTAADPEREKQLEKIYSEIEAINDLDAARGLPEMRKLLEKTEYRALGISAHSYFVKEGLDRWSRQGSAAEALQLFENEAGAPGKPLPADTTLAVLQLRAGKTQAALATLEQMYAVEPDERIGQSIGSLRSGLAGGDLMSAFPNNVKRPWQWSSAYPICDFFGADGPLSEMHTVDLIAAFHGEREAAMWMLAQEWPSVIAKCFQYHVWDEARERVQYVFGREGFETARDGALASIELGSDAHLMFGGTKLPLPDLEWHFDSNAGKALAGTPMSREQLVKIVQASGLLSDKPSLPGPPIESLQ